MPQTDLDGVDGVFDQFIKCAILKIPKKKPSMACLINLLNNGVDGVDGVDGFDGVNGVFDNLPNFPREIEVVKSQLAKNCCIFTSFFNKKISHLKSFYDFLDLFRSILEKFMFGTLGY